MAISVFSGGCAIRMITSNDGILTFINFLPRDAMLARYMLWRCVCVSVGLCVLHKSEFYQDDNNISQRRYLGEIPTG